MAKLHLSSHFELSNVMEYVCEKIWIQEQKCYRNRPLNFTREKMFYFSGQCYLDFSLLERKKINSALRNIIFLSQFFH